MASRKQFYDLERMMKGVANHRRVEILHLLLRGSDLSSEDIVAKLNINYQTGCSHIRALTSAGLVAGYRQGSSIIHTLTPHGKSIIIFLEKLK